MSAAYRIAQNIIPNSLSGIAFNPVVTATLLWVLTKAPKQVRDALFEHISTLRDPVQLARVLKVLKGFLALGVIGTVNAHLNTVSLNAGRWSSQKQRWNLSKEIAVVTGGCSGIGELIVKGLLGKGVRVAVLDIQQLPLDLQGNPNIKFFACDVTDPSAVYSAADRIRASLGSPSILINNAGIAKAGSILNTSDDWLRKIFDVNLLSNFTTVKAFLPDMISKDKGHIVTIASMASFIAVGGMTDYCSTKAGVLAFHEGLNEELKHHYKAQNILTTSVHPNWVQTPLLKPFEKAIKAMNNPVIEPREVADAVVNQISAASSAQILIPNSARSITLLRGFPNWLQNRARGGLSKAILATVK